MDTNNQKTDMSRSSAILFALILLAIVVGVSRNELLFRMMDKKLQVLDIDMEGKAKKVPVVPVEWLMPPGKIVFQKLNEDLNVESLIGGSSEDATFTGSFDFEGAEVILAPHYQFPKVIRLKNYDVKQNSEGEWIAERKEQ